MNTDKEFRTALIIFGLVCGGVLLYALTPATAPAPAPARQPTADTVPNTARAPFAAPTLTLGAFRHQRARGQCVELAVVNSGRSTASISGKVEFQDRRGNPVRRNDFTMEYVPPGGLARDGGMCELDTSSIVKVVILDFYYCRTGGEFVRCHVGTGINWQKDLVVVPVELGL